MSPNLQIQATATLLRGLNKETENTTLLMVELQGKQIAGDNIWFRKSRRLPNESFFSLTDIDEKVNKYDTDTVTVNLLKQ